MDKYLKYFLWFLLAITISLILYLIIKIIIFYFKAKNAFNTALSNSKYCQKDICDPTPEQLDKQLPTVAININQWQIEVAKYCSVIIYSIIKAARDNVKPIYPTDLVVVKELYDSKTNPIYGTIFTDKSISENIWIIFRGSSSTNEWEEDFNVKQEQLFQSQSVKQSHNIKQTTLSFLNTSNGKIAKVHEGFINIYTNFRNELLSTMKTIDPNKNKTIIVSGHSLGAAIATLVGIDLLQSGYTNIVVYSFASPRIGDNVFKTIVDDELKLPVYRLVNISDIIPDTPLSVSPNLDDCDDPYIYVHCGILIPFQINRLSILNNHLIPNYMAGLETNLVPTSLFP